MSKPTANLIYNAQTELLSGAIGKDSFNLPAFSGGSRGHSAVSPETAELYRHTEARSMFSRFANTATEGHGTAKDPYKQRGGTLPPGHYSCVHIAHHKTFGECVWLKRGMDTHIRYPTASGVSLDNRDDDFYIHGSGPKGSDGCIVVPNSVNRHRLNKAIRDFSRSGSVILQVINVAYALPAERDDIALA
jgi:hypothetical protein